MSSIRTYLCHAYDPTRGGDREDIRIAGPILASMIPASSQSQ
jgi:hypothetical protein